ncbi:MAG: hypothetical protein BGO07_03005 [Alphaproteobacteria bacterium 40-19]|nr:MAG: hypothetical protein BGO07_03005 [Alphaproteobacteria bacterium 40-19]
MKKYFLLMLLSAGSLLAKDTVLSNQVLPEKVLKLGEDQQKLITFLRKSKMLKGSKKQKQDMLFLVLSQMKNSNFQQVCRSLGIRLQGKKARITVANRKKFQDFFKKENAADVEKAYSSLAQSYLKSYGASSSVSGTLPSEKEVEALLKQGEFEEALTQAKKQGTPHNSGAELTKAPIVWGAGETKTPSSEAPIVWNSSASQTASSEKAFVWGASEHQTSSGASQSLLGWYTPYAPSTKDFVEVFAAARGENASLITNVALRSQFEKKLLNSTDKMENESLNQQVEDVLQEKRRVAQIQADLILRTTERNDARAECERLREELEELRRLEGEQRVVPNQAPGENLVEEEVVDAHEGQNQVPEGEQRVVPNQAPGENPVEEQVARRSKKLQEKIKD